MVASFGRRPEPVQEMPGPVVLPAVHLPPVRVPIVLIVDVDSLAAASGQIAAMVADAVRAGFAQAVQELEVDVPAPPASP